MMIYDVIIIGSGPAGLTAAIYTTRANLKTLLIAGGKWGGQLMLTTTVDNYPGFPEGIQGPDLMMAMRKQAERFGTEFVDEDFEEGDFGKEPFKIKAGEKTFEGKSVIIATGADTKWLDVPGEKEKIGKGVSSCAPCDAFFFKNKKTIVVGGGDSAMEEAIVLANFADSVTVVHRREELRASAIMQKIAMESPKIKFLFNTEVTKILGDEKVTGIELKHNKTGEVSKMDLDGVFVAIGHTPNTGRFRGIELDEKGYIKVHDHTRTNIDGVFVAGDVHDSHYRQAVTAAGFGCMAALESETWLRKTTD
ncbi:MAG: thioredoxin-disulfide reductase [Candidatus Levybacteria bacterium RIFCSPLOWO2_01_FULL_38_13]|nr:MAG: thioredoxin-disulfide reductase [Candidatus Levybacteria bacterium RIFCSPHIGHO2_01_FULL_41_15]OGH34608.1 MAG: thioredoxin-disulfide reductase [Candidatus Levybacteria bacterium RIFCSPLOWO2_01_FULL_38_13]